MKGMNVTSLGRNEQPNEQVNAQQGQFQYGQPSKQATQEQVSQGNQSQVAIEGETNKEGG